MPLNITGAHSSRITKPGPPTRSPLRRTSSTRKSASASPSSSTSSPLPPRLPDAGAPRDLRAHLAPSSAPPPVPSNDVLALVPHVYRTAFDPVPDRGAGLASTRVAEILRLRAALPPLATWAHVLALAASATGVEREVAAAVGRGELRRVVLAGRGAGRGGGEGEGLVKVEDWVEVVRRVECLGREMVDKYITHLRHTPSSPHPPAPFTSSEATTLTHVGLLTSASATAPTSLVGTPSSGSTLASISTAGSTAPSGSLGAVGGHDAFHAAGGGLSRAAHDHDTRNGGKADSDTASHVLALPNTGPLLKLIVAARTHLLELLRKASPRHREAPLSALRERWDGGVDAGRTTARRGGDGVLPGRTRKWREFHGLRFEWVLAECVGTGVVECFETGSVGVGVRAV